MCNVNIYITNIFIGSVEGNDEVSILNSGNDERKKIKKSLREFLKTVLDFILAIVNFSALF
jgi:hypothetical protein